MFDYLVTLSGIGYMPSKFGNKDKFNITAFMDAGEVNQAGQVSDVGYIAIEGESLLEVLGNAKSVRNQCDVIDSVEIDIIYQYENQCNLELSENEISSLNELGAKLNISCFTSR